MKKLSRKLYSLVLLWFFFGLIVTTGSYLLRTWFSPTEPDLGVTFSSRYATELGLDWQEVYIATLDDLQVKNLRIPLYWSQIEMYSGERDYSQIDWMMNEAEKRQVKVTLVIGEKVPRWPECYVPVWADGVSKAKTSAALEAYLTATVERYRDFESLHRWQVENEYLFPFGVCAAPDSNRFRAEIELVRELDSNHQIQLTTSGEQSFWAVTALRADVLGVSLYQRAWNDLVGFVVLPVSPVTYAVQAKIASLFTEEVIISEMQAEPWVPGTWDRTDKEQLNKFYRLFTAQDILLHLTIAQQTGVDEVYLWGVEWWYYLDQQGDARLWHVAKTIFNH